MCGIGGVVSFSGSPDPAIAERMTDRMQHRGPDSDGVYATGPALLAHRRLSIIDLSDAGYQPMANADATVHIVFNGEVYNYRELRERVSNYPFRSETDTEVLLHLYEEYGVECLSMLRGMFAFAIWDENERRLFLARDRLGQKPLFYHHSDDTFRFGSTIKVILADEDVTATPDLDAIRSYLAYQYVPHPDTGFEGIRSVAPGEYMIVSDDRIHREQYWEVSYRDQFTCSPTRMARRLRSELLEATELRMRSDVPVGLFLSGGIDSSIVAALMDSVTDKPIETFSVGFDIGAYDELDFARSIARAYDTNHHEYTVTPDSIELLPKLVEQYEMPFGDPSALPTYYVSQVASNEVTVALTGDAGDENFAGYDRYTYDYLASCVSRVPRSLRTNAQRGLFMLPTPFDGWTKTKHAKRFLRSTNGDPVQRYAEFICHATNEDIDQVWTKSTPNDELGRLRTAFANADGPTRTDRLMNVDIDTYLPDDLLVKVDRASMAHSIEARSPFLDHEFVEFAARIPAKYKWRRGKKKWLLKRAFEPELPEQVLTRSKQGFSVPVHEWFRGELREFARERLDRLGARVGFDRSGLHERLEAHVTGRADNGYQLWDLVMLELWYERFID
jgi:asparagine synthase (glutamine-hydrolysing)